MSQQEFDQVVNRMGTYSTQWDYVEDRFGEKDLLPFTISDMDFAAPNAIIKALRERLQHPVFGYTRWNHDDYKGPIVRWFSKRFNSNIDSNWIIYSPSVVYSISKLIELNSAVGDGVLIQTPTYDAFFKTIQSSGRKTVENPLYYNEGEYSIDFKDMENKLSDPSTKVFLLCNPQNPTGNVWSKEHLEKIVNLCKKYDVFLISDEIHMDVVFNENVHTPITEFVGVYNRMALCSSTSKSFNVPGLGGSYLFIPEESLRDKFQVILKGRDGLSSASILGITATMAAYNEGNQWIDGLNEYVYNNLVFVKEYLEKYIPAITFKIPQSTYLAWMDIGNLPYTMDELQHALVHHGKVAIMYGDIYGGNGEEFLRLNVGCPRSKLEEGLERLRKSIDYLDRSK